MFIWSSEGLPKDVRLNLRRKERAPHEMSGISTVRVHHLPERSSRRIGRERGREKKEKRERERKKDGMSTDGQTRIPSSFLNSSMSSITWLVMAEVGGGSPRRPVAGAGYWMAASHLSRACGSVAGDGVGTERNGTAQHEEENGERKRKRGIEQRQRGRLRESGVLLESAWKLRMYGWWDGPGRAGGGFGGAARKHHRHSVRHTAFSVDARTE